MRIGKSKFGVNREEEIVNVTSIVSIPLLLMHHLLIMF